MKPAATYATALTVFVLGKQLVQASQGALAETHTSPASTAAGLRGEPTVPYPLDAIFKPMRNVSRTPAGRGLEWVNLDEGEDGEQQPEDWETLPDYSLTVAASGGHCALAVLHALPRGAPGKLATLVLLAAALTAVKKSLKVPLAVMVRGLLAAKQILAPRSRSLPASGEPTSDPLDWASLFEGLYPLTEQTQPHSGAHMPPLPPTTTHSGPPQHGR